MKPKWNVWVDRIENNAVVSDDLLNMPARSSRRSVERKLKIAADLLSDSIVSQGRLIRLMATARVRYDSRKLTLELTDLQRDSQQQDVRLLLEKLALF